MTAIRLPRRSISVAVVVGALALSACGSDDGTQLPPPLDTGGATTAPEDPDPADSDPDAPTGDSEQVLGTANIGGPVVDPQPHAIDDIAIAESYPEQLMVTFTSGDPNCTAADATATATGSKVIVTLEVGITEDALQRSCEAGEFTQTISIALESGLDGREVIAAAV